MKYSLILSFILCSFLVSKELCGQSFVQQGNKWVHCFIPFFDTGQEFKVITEMNAVFQMDTLICTNIQVDFPDQERYYVESFKLCSSEQNRVYYEMSDTLYLLYDFNLVEGDTYRIRYPEQHDLRDFSFLDAPNWIECRIDSVENVTIEGKEFLRQHISTDFQYFYATKITEGFGFDYWLLPFYTYDFAESDFFQNILTYKTPDFFYSNTGIGCTLSSVQTANLKAPSKIYPNPVSDLIYINDVEQLDFVEVYDVNGKLLTRGKWSKNILVGLSNGLKIFKIYRFDKSITIQKVIYTGS